MAEWIKVTLVVWAVVAAVTLEGLLRLARLALAATARGQRQALAEAQARIAELEARLAARVL